ncbi:hypothetical protein IMCC20628_00422 [Hoeflea sp. IMCC20628]|uniref:transferrin-binding protein-like solute binding protein n=1 Tax=Hoeflea sp. IMCC20628 TaxID=1620421 RepID=UPI00063BF351|nr:transferrin-binding protein-like solute binding protein [Hoeflea sp. IMCC20628]AKH99149.1 hypothetical protein IMCC20628_00422 [Hoeflea sp. IMCC20628]
MNKSALISGAVVLAILPVVSACSPSGGTLAGPAAGGSLPIKASGKALAYRVNATNTSSVSSYTNLPQSQHQITQARILEKSAPGGITIDGAADVDPDPNTNQGNNPALITATSTDQLENGTTLVGMTDAKGSIYFDGGNFGDAQVSNEHANLSSVGVYNRHDSNGKFVEQIVLKHGTTIRYQEGADGAATSVQAVGFIGNNTTNMPMSGQATYRGFHEGGTSVYDDNGNMQNMGLNGGEVELTADFGAGTVKGGIKNGQLAAYKDSNMLMLNPNVTGLNINANITGSDYTGTAQLVDSNNNPVGTSTYNEAIGSFFGDAAAETAAAYVIEGNAEIDGQNRDYLMTGTFGAVKN